MVGQEDEASAELLATIQHDHVPMKKFYNTSTSPEAQSLREKYGPTYPSIWREVINWPGWKDSRRAFLKVSEQGSSSAASSVPPTRKRKSRWATADPSSASTTTNDNGNTAAAPAQPKRKSRWARGRDETPKPVNSAIPGLGQQQQQPSGTVLDLLPGLPTNLNQTDMVELQALQKKLREANEKLDNLEAKAAKIDALPVGHADRSPSPPPVYGADGKRKNTRAIRWRERYTAQRQDTLEQILFLTSKSSNSNPTSVAPSLFKRKRTRKIHIPIEDHPTYNFIGLIIGPRGKTQKDMEMKTGCKIAIRGKGSVKEGARGRRDGKMMDGDDEPLHVVVTGDNQAAVDAAADMVQQMLVVIDDDKNVHKQQQLRELALLNGTLKEDEFCPTCGEKGHRAFECPKRFSLNKKTGISIKCAICGDTSHPTRDCTQKKLDDGKDEKQLDSDYLAFMNELDGKPVPAPSADVCKIAEPLKEDGVEVTVPTGITTSQSEPDKPNPPPTTTNTSSVITTISSRIIKNTDNTEIGVTPVTTPATTAPLPPTVGVAPPIPPSIPGVQSTSSILPPPASTVVPPPPPSLTQASNTGTTPMNLPPPPPPVANNTYGQQQQQQYYPNQQPQQQYGNAYNNAGYPPYQGQQQQYGNNNGTWAYNNNRQQSNTSANTNGWDYRSYYGNGENSNDAGAGGFNWWES